MSLRFLQDALHEAMLDALADRDDALGDELADREQTIDPDEDEQ